MVETNRASIIQNITLNKRVLSLFFFLVGFILYIPFLSTNYDLNGVLEAEKLEAGEIFTPNHILYRPTGFLVYKGLQTFVSYEGRSLPVLQMITAIFASLGLSFSFLAFEKMSQSILRAALATIGMGVSWSYWHFSTEALYLPMAMPFIAVAILSLLLVQPGSKHAMYYATISGIACAGAILVWQANIFLFLVVGIGYLILYQPATFKIDSQIIRLALITFVTAGLIVAIIYIGIGIIFFEVRSPADFLGWVLHHPGDSLTSWGRWGLDRFPDLLYTGMSSIIPLWEGLGLRDLSKGVVNPAKISGQISLLAYFILCLGILVYSFRYITSKQTNLRLLFWLIASYLVYIPFILWWDPTEPLWFIIVNFFFWGGVATIWKMPNKDKGFFSLSLLSPIIFVIGFANFSQTIWPNYSQPNDMLQQASCVNDHMNSQDTLLVTDWTWPGYVSYFYKRPITGLIWNPGDPEIMMDGIRERVAHSQQVGGQVIIIDVNSYPAGYLDWLEMNTGLTKNHFNRLSVTPIFTCNTTQFYSVTGVQ